MVPYAESMEIWDFFVDSFWGGMLNASLEREYPPSVPREPRGRWRKVG